MTSVDCWGSPSPHSVDGMTDSEYGTVVGISCPCGEVLPVDLRPYLEEEDGVVTIQIAPDLTDLWAHSLTHDAGGPDMDSPDPEPITGLSDSPEDLQARIQAQEAAMASSSTKDIVFMGVITLVAVAALVTAMIALTTFFIWIPFAVFAPALGYTFWQLAPVGLVVYVIAMWIAAVIRRAGKTTAKIDNGTYMGGK